MIDKGKRKKKKKKKEDKNKLRNRIMLRYMRRKVAGRGGEERIREEEGLKG